MNTILITVLLTLLGAGLVVLLVWLGVVSRKSIKFIRKMKKQNLLLQNTIEENRLSAESSDGVVYDNLYREIEELSKRVEDEIHHRQNSITTTQNNIENVERKTDSRLDKLHDMIKNQIAQAKKLD